MMDRCFHLHEKHVLSSGCQFHHVSVMHTNMRLLCVFVVFFVFAGSFHDVTIKRSVLNCILFTFLWDCSIAFEDSNTLKEVLVTQEFIVCRFSQERSQTGCYQLAPEVNHSSLFCCSGCLRLPSPGLPM